MLGFSCLPDRAAGVLQDEMCNLYMMVFADIPYFITCVNDAPWMENPRPGGIPTKSSLVPELDAVWQPPPPVDVGTAEGWLGQVTGGSQVGQERP
jgi:hypothetical protein